MYTGKDRRLFRRVEGDLAVRYMLPDSDKEYSTATRNISGGGMRISLLKRLPPGTILEMEIFRKDSSSSARFKGEIRWISHMAMNRKAKKSVETGIKFINLSFLFLGTLIYDLETQDTAAHLQNYGTN